MENRSFVPATLLHLEPPPDKTQAAIDHLKQLGYTVIPPAEEEKKLRAA